MGDDPDKTAEFNPNKLDLRLHLAIPGDVKAISPVVDKIMWVAGKMGCIVGSEFEIETALREALANAVVHGCKEDRKKEVEFVVACDDTRGMMILIRDPGGGFNPKEIPSPIEGQCLYSEHGRGIYLINQLMDEVRFDKGGTEIFMRKG
jgi:serine/threonine-protein kinase RsbW